MSGSELLSVTKGKTQILNKIPDQLALYGNVALVCLFIYSAGDMMWAAALASISAFYLGFVSGRNNKPDQ